MALLWVTMLLHATKQGYLEDILRVYSTSSPIGAVQLDVALLGNPIEAYTTKYSIREKKSNNYVFYYPNKNIGMIDTEDKIKVKKVIIFYIAEFYGF